MGRGPSFVHPAGAVQRTPAADSARTPIEHRLSDTSSISLRMLEVYRSTWPLTLRHAPTSVSGVDMPLRTASAELAMSALVPLVTLTLAFRTNGRRDRSPDARSGGGTAIGEALGEARPDLYRAGVFRKYLLVVTDGENTSGRPPDRVAREIFRKSEGAVQVYFVAFDTSPEKFAFLKDAGGDVIGAGTGAELRQALDGIYQGRILAEAPGAGEREPARR